MRLLLPLLVALGVAAEEPLAPGWEKTGATARDDVVLEVWRVANDPIGRVVLRNRTEHEVRVAYRVSSDLSTHLDYATVIPGSATLGLSEPIPVPIGSQPRPEFTVVAVTRLPITESSGYVRMAEHERDGVGAWIYRRVDGGERAYLVLRNPGARAVDVVLRLSGLADVEQVLRERIPARTTRGEDGALRLTYRPLAGYPVPVRVRIETVGAQP